MRESLSLQSELGSNDKSDGADKRQSQKDMIAGELRQLFHDCSEQEIARGRGLYQGRRLRSGRPELDFRLNEAVS